MRQCEYEEIYDPDIGMHVEKHIYGEGITDIFKAVGRKLFGKTAKDVAKTAAKSAVTKAAMSTGEYAGKKAGDKIIELLSKKRNTTPSIERRMETEQSKLKKMTQQEVNERVNQILSGGKLRRKNFYLN